MSRLPIVVAITGASGAVYAQRLLHTLLAAQETIHLTISSAAAEVFQQEAGFPLELKHPDFRKLLTLRPPFVDASDRLPPVDSFDESAFDRLIYHPVRDYQAGIASGSFLTAGMVICPCSMGTLASIATGQSQNLIHRSADVHLKERRKLIVVPRETPLSSIALENMKRLADLGVVVLPAMPGFYHEPRSMLDLVDFVVARICDQLGVAHPLGKRWGENSTKRK